MATDNIEPRAVQGELVEAPSDASLSANMQMIQISSREMFAAAKMKDRDYPMILRQLTELVEAYPQSADESIYSKPVGTVMQVTCKCGIKYEIAKVTREETCPDCGKPSIDNDGARSIKKFAEGLSIRAAENIRSIYGMNQLTITMELVADGNVKICGTFTDCCTMAMTTDERIVSRWYKARSGGMVKTPEDRFYGVVVKAEKAKLRRDLILDNTPAIVKASYRDACEQKILELVSPEAIEQKIVPAFATYGISRADLALIIGRPVGAGMTKEDRLTLQKLHSAFKNGETDAHELMEGIRRNIASEAGNGENGLTEAALSNAKEVPEPDAERPGKKQKADKGRKPPTKASKPPASNDTPTPQKSSDAQTSSSDKPDSDDARYAKERKLLWAAFEENALRAKGEKGLEDARMKARLAIEQDRMLMGKQTDVDALVQRIDSMTEELRTNLP